MLPDTAVAMQPPLVLKQDTTTRQVDMQPGMVIEPMTVNSNMPISIPNIMTPNKPSSQNIVTTQNLGSARLGVIHDVQILNMRPGASPAAAQKSEAGESPRVMVGGFQVVGTQAAVRGASLQNLQNLQPHQQDHLWLMTDKGEYQLLRAGPGPTANTFTVPQSQIIQLSNVPTHPSVATILMNMGQMPAASVVASANNMASIIPVLPLTRTTVISSNNTKEKCRNFLANLLDLSSKESPSVKRNVKKLIQELIDAQVEPEEFCYRLERLLNASPQPYLVGFLKKSLPLLRSSLVTTELAIKGINHPTLHVTSSSLSAPVQPVMAPSNMKMKRSQKPSSNTIAVLQNTPVHSKLNVGNMNCGISMTARPSGPSGGLSTVCTQTKSLLKEKEKKLSTQSYLEPFGDYKMAGNDDINDVAAMGGVNLAEETQRFLGPSEMIGAQIRSCKDEYQVSLSEIQTRVRVAAARHNMEEPSTEVASLISHAVQERLKNLVEKLAVVAQYRIDLIKTDSRYEIFQDVRSQLKFLKVLDRLDKNRREDLGREILLYDGKSRSKNVDPQQATLKAEAKEMQRTELEELRQRKANITAMQAIGLSKMPRLECPGTGRDSVVNNNTQHNNVAYTSRSQLALSTRLKRVNYRDMIFLLEQERETSFSLMLYKSYLK